MKKYTKLEKLEFESAKNVIIDNLKNGHHSKLVNFCCATRKLETNRITFDALQFLISNGSVKTKTWAITGKFGIQHEVTSYRFSI